MRPTLTALLLAAAAAAAAWTAAIWIGGGFTLALGPIHLTSYDVRRPLVLAIAAFAGALAAGGVSGVRRQVAAITPSIPAAPCAAALAIATAATGLVYNSWTGSGPDSFAYVSQAALWQHGALAAPATLAADAPWPRAVETFAPFGYRAAPHGAPALVPVTAPGVPLMMAALQTIGGHAAAFVLTPLCGGALVWLTFLIGRRVRSPAAGLIAAWLVATSPALLFMLMWPMTDVPAAAIAAFLIWLLLRGRTATAAFMAGVAAGLGVLTRPNFILIAAAAGAWMLLDARAASREDDASPRAGWWARAAAFALGLAPAIAITLGLNARWYGAALASGYGAAGELTSFALLPRNVSYYARWLAASSPLAFAGIAALAWPSTRWWGRRGRAAAWLLGLTSGAAVSIYLVYGRFVDWWYLRFLLPAWPAWFVGTAVVAEAIRARGRIAAAVVLLVTLWAGVAGVSLADARGIFGLGQGERRYVSVARVAADATDPDAVILTWQHSGTIRYYAGRETLRWDLLDPAWLDRTVAWLAAHGRHPYLLLEDWEQPIFQAQFKGSDLARLDFPPVAAWQAPRIAGWVWVYDPLNRTRVTVERGADVEASQPIVAPAAAHPWRGLY